MRRATVKALNSLDNIVLISIHALHAESDHHRHRKRCGSYISIHALHAESDMKNCIRKHNSNIFLSTLSMRRATQYLIRHLLIHLFLSTLSMRRATREASKRIARLTFLSTLSMRRATYSQIFLKAIVWISIHALHAESDLPRVIAPGVQDNFYPRSPCGERQRARESERRAIQISIHALHAESDMVLHFFLPLL